MIRSLAALLLWTSLTSLSLAQVGSFNPTSSPVSPTGVRAAADLPPGQHMRNTGGSDGSGLCVFTSIEMDARWQNIVALAGYRAWMERRPGGGWPEKVDQTLAEFCREKGVPVPRYVQHTTGDLAFLDLAIRTGRSVGITYAGNDGFYRGAINHMVFLSHIDSERAAIIDNNRPGSWIWMTRDELKSRWLASADRFGRWVSSGGGWAVVFLDSPPPPYPSAPTEAVQARFDCGCGRGPDCTCGPDCGCPPAFGQDCANGRCRAPLRSTPGVAAEPIGTPPTNRHYWGQWDDGSWGWRLNDTPTGVVPELISKHPAYSVNGQASTREEVHSLLQQGSLADDSSRWHLAVVGDAAFLGRVRDDVAKLAADVREKLHVQTFTPSAWQVSQFKLPSAGVVLRKPAAGRVSADVGAIAAAEYSSTRLDDLIGDPAGPSPKPVPPKPAPGPNDSPVPSTPAAPTIPWKWLVAGGFLYLVTRKK